MNNLNITNGKKVLNAPDRPQKAVKLHRLINLCRSKMNNWSEFNQYCTQMQINYALKAIELNDYVMMNDSYDNLEHILNNNGSIEDF